MERLARTTVAGRALQHAETKLRHLHKARPTGLTPCRRLQVGLILWKLSEGGLRGGVVFLLVCVAGV